jgi:hypothetical protein
VQILKFCAVALVVAGCATVPRIEPLAGSGTPAPAATPTATPSPAPVLSGTIREFIRRYPEATCIGVYLKGQKIGYEIEKWTVGAPPAALKKRNPQLREVAWTQVESKMRMEVLGEVTEETSTTRTCYSLESPGQPLWSEEIAWENGHKKVIEVFAVGNQMEISATGEEKRTVPVPRDNIDAWRAVESWLRSPQRREGDTYRTWQAMWDQEPIESALDITYVSAERSLFQGKQLQTYAVKMRLQGINMDGQVTSRLHPVKMKAAGFMEMMAESQSQVRNLKGLAQWSDWGLPVNQPLKNVERLQKLSLLALASQDLKLPESDRQRVSRSGDGWRIDLRRDEFDTEAPLSDADREKYLKVDYSTQCTPDMAALASRLAPDKLTALEKAERIQDWIYKTMEKSSQRQGQTAQAAFRNRAGDCTEHSLLFVALCRASGVPARLAAGCMYAGGKPPFFGWHQWAEVHDGKRWVSMDPTWRQVGVDVSHILFSHDPEDMSAFNTVGQLKFQVLEAK